MALEKRTVLDQIEIKADGMVFMRLMKQVVDGDAVLSSEPHRSVIDPGTTTVDQMKLVNDHLVVMGWPALPTDQIERLNSHVEIAHTPEVIARAVKEKVAVVERISANQAVAERQRG